MDQVICHRSSLFMAAVGLEVDAPSDDFWLSLSMVVAAVRSGDDSAAVIDHAAAQVTPVGSGLHRNLVEWT